MSNRHFAVIGDPIAHSLSPLLHQTAFDVISDIDNISRTYAAYQVKKEDLAQFMDMFYGRKSTRVFRPFFLLKKGNRSINVTNSNNYKNQKNCLMEGLSVTLPHKKEIMQYASKVTPLAQLVGAANTLYWEKGQLVADNTDVAGFLAPLRKEYSIVTDIYEGISEDTGSNSKMFNELKSEHFKNEKLTAMILGAGGAAAAVLIGLLHIPCMKKIYVCARNIEQAKNLCEHIKKIAQENTLSEQINKSIFLVPEVISFAEKNKKVDLVVNTIPATLSGQSFNPRDDFEGVKIAYDVLYAHTPFLQSAKEQRVRIINGGEMFLQQGARQFKLWTGQDMPQKALDKVQEQIGES